MKEEELYDILGDIDEAYILEAHEPLPRVKRNSALWIKWSVAVACLCMMYIQVAFPKEYNPLSFREKNLNGGNYTAENHGVGALGKLDAYRIKELGGYLPTGLPAGYYFETGYCYNITMEDGTKGKLLLVTYLNGEGRKQERLEWAVMNYKPVTEAQIYRPEDITREKLLEIGILDFYISYGDVYVGISTKNADIDDLLKMIQNIE